MQSKRDENTFEALVVESTHRDLVEIYGATVGAENDNKDGLTLGFQNAEELPQHCSSPRTNQKMIKCCFPQNRASSTSKFF